VRRLLVLALWVSLLSCSERAGREPLVLRIAVPGPLTRVDPRLAESNSALATDLVFQTVLHPDRDGRPRSHVARALERLGPTRFRIALDPAARFSDGSPVAFDDVARAVSLWDMTATREGEWIVLESPSGAIEAKLFYSAVYREAGGEAIGTGPFRVVEQTPWKVDLERVRPVPGRIDRVQLVAFPSGRDTLARTLRGETNGVYGLTDRQVEFLEGVPSLKVTRTPGPQTRAVVFDHQTLSPDEIRALRAALPLGRIAPLACSRPELRNPNLPEVAGEVRPGRPLTIAALVPDQATTLVGLALRRALGPRGGPIQRADPTAARGPAADITLRSMLVWPPVVLALSWATGSPGNTTGFSSAAVDAAFARGDVEAAAAEIDQTAPFVALCRAERIAAFDARIRNPTLGWWGVLDTLPEWEVEP
jgi:hypothetical protein